MTKKSSRAEFICKRGINSGSYESIERTCQKGVTPPEEGLWKFWVQVGPWTGSRTDKGGEGGEKTETAGKEDRRAAWGQQDLP